MCWAERATTTQPEALARRHLGEGGIVYSRKIERALTLDELLPHLNPLVDAIAEQVGSELAAEFADTAAFILSPR